MQQHKLELATSGRGMVDITPRLSKLVGESDLQTGLCHVFLHHTSASLVICENADPLVQKDMEAFLQRLIPDGDPMFTHTAEGPDDMPSHVRTILTQSFITVPITTGKLVLGTWQSIYLWEHRVQPHHRHMTVTIYS